MTSGTEVFPGVYSWRTLTLDHGRATHLLWSPDGERLLIGTDSGRLIVWSPDEGGQIALRNPDSLPITAASWAPDSTRVAFANDSHHIRLMMAENGGLTGNVPVFRGRNAPTPPRISSLAWSATGRFAIGASTGEVGLWTHGDQADDTVFLSPAHDGAITDLAWHPTDDEVLLSVALDARPRIWQVAKGTSNPCEPKHWAAVTSAIWTTNGRQFLSGGRDKEVRFWGYPSGTEARPPLSQHGEQIESIAISGDGRMLASRDIQGRVIIWSCKDGKNGHWSPSALLQSSHVVDSLGKRIALSPTEPLLAITGASGQAIHIRKLDPARLAGQNTTINFRRHNTWGGLSETVKRTLLRANRVQIEATGGHLRYQVEIPHLLAGLREECLSSGIAFQESIEVSYTILKGYLDNIPELGTIRAPMPTNSTHLPPEDESVRRLISAAKTLAENEKRTVVEVADILEALRQSTSPVLTELREQTRQALLPRNPIPPRRNAQDPFYPSIVLRGGRLRNIRGFRDASFALQSDPVQPTWGLLFGENGAGKTTLLRAIAIGLSSESQSHRLLGAKGPSLLTSGFDKGEIILDLEVGGSPERIVTKIERKGSSSVKITKEWDFDLETVTDSVRWFACAYGPNRFTAPSSEQIEHFDLGQSLAPLFSHDVRIQQPELFLRRHLSGEQLRDALAALDQLLLLPQGSCRLESSGLVVDGPWGAAVRLEDLGEGYQSTFAWVFDLFAWAVLDWSDWQDQLDHTGPPSPLGEPAFPPDLSAIRGIVLVDELEQHLHPRWQREVLIRLSEILPNLQIIATTHAPMIAVGSGALPRDRIEIISLMQGKAGAEIRRRPEGEAAQRVDKVLTSELFSLHSTNPPGIEADIQRLHELNKLEALTADESAELNQLTNSIETAFEPYEFDYQREIAQTIRDVVFERLSEAIKSGKLAATAVNAQVQLQVQRVLLGEQTAPKTPGDEVVALASEAPEVDP